MNESKTHFQFANIVFHNDERTPLEFVVQTLRLFLNKPEREAREIAGYVNRLGRFSCGVYPLNVAQAVADEAAKYAAAAGYALRIEIERLVSTDAEGQSACSFCGKREAAFFRQKHFHL